MSHELGYDHVLVLIFDNEQAEDVRKITGRLYGLCHPQNFGIYNKTQIYYSYPGSLAECTEKATKLIDALSPSLFSSLRLMKLTPTLIHTYK